jgi:hypothetical protein
MRNSLAFTNMIESGFAPEAAEQSLDTTPINAEVQ